MSDEIITLTGDAVWGIDGGQFRGIPSPPRVVRLGRNRPAALPKTLRMEDYFDTHRMTTPPPLAINRRAKAAASLARMYKNDQLGCCVISGKFHQLGVWSGNDTLTTVIATDDEIVNQYHAICGPGDRGCFIPDVLNHFRDKGLVAGGVTYKIDGYVAVDWRDKVKTQVAQIIFGATTIGINLPAAWTSAAVWDVTNTRIVGGHDVTPIDYDEQGVYVSSWGKIYLITWAAWTSTKWLEEYYAVLAPLWYNDDRLAPNGFDVVKLKADLDKIGGGGLPDIDQPTPPPPTPPPAPPTARGYTVVQGSVSAFEDFLKACNAQKLAGWHTSGGIGVSGYTVMQAFERDAIPPAPPVRQ